MAKGKLHNLMFHGVVDKMPEYSIFEESRNCFVTTKDFENIIKYCSSNFRILNQSEIDDFVNSNPETDAIFITFDDGLESVFTKALPILQKYNTPATVFVTTGWVDSKNSPSIFNIEKIVFENMPIRLNVKKLNFSKTYLFSKKKDINKNFKLIWKELFQNNISPLSLDDSNFEFDTIRLNKNPRIINDLWKPATWAQIKSAVNSNLIELGTHGVTHIPWSWLNNIELETELKISLNTIHKNTGYNCKTASFPHGMYKLDNLDVLNNKLSHYFANNMNLISKDDKLLGRLLIPYDSPNSIKALIDFKYFTIIIHLIKNKIKSIL